MTSNYELIIQPRSGWRQINLEELWSHRELLGFLVWRDIKIRYKQTLLGGVWALLQPLLAMLIFVALFSRVSSMHHTSAPYALFVFAGLVPWTFFANAVMLSSNSLVGSEQMIRKIYFPRLLVPIGTVLGFGLDMLVGFGFLLVLLALYQWPLTLALFWLPPLVVLTFLAPAGIGLFLSALNVRFRDVKYVVPFLVQMMFFTTPVIYPLSYVPEKYRFLLFFNPMAGVVEGYRHAFLGVPLNGDLLLSSCCVSILVFTFGLLYFRRMERTFADVI